MKTALEGKPLSGKILVEPISEQVSESGLVVSQDANQRTGRGKVVSMGEGAEQEGLFVGATVLFHPRGGTIFELEGKDYTLLRLEEIYYAW